MDAKERISNRIRRESSSQKPPSIGTKIYYHTRFFGNLALAALGVGIVGQNGCGQGGQPCDGNQTAFCDNIARLQETKSKGCEVQRRIDDGSNDDVVVCNLEKNPPPNPLTPSSGTPCPPGAKQATLCRALGFNDNDGNQYVCRSIPGLRPDKPKENTDICVKVPKPPIEPPALESKKEKVSEQQTITEQKPEQIIQDRDAGPIDTVTLDTPPDNPPDNIHDAIPEKKPETKAEKPQIPEIKPEIRPETKPELRPEIKPEIRPELKTEPIPEKKPEIKPEPKPEPKAEPRPEPHIEPLPDDAGTPPEPQIEIKPEIKPEITPEPPPVDQNLPPLYCDPTVYGQHIPPNPPNAGETVLPNTGIRIAVTPHPSTFTPITELLGSTPIIRILPAPQNAIIITHPIDQTLCDGLEKLKGKSIVFYAVIPRGTSATLRFVTHRDKSGDGHKGSDTFFEHALQRMTVVVQETTCARIDSACLTGPITNLTANIKKDTATYPNFHSTVLPHNCQPTLPSSVGCQITTTIPPRQ